MIYYFYNLNNYKIQLERKRIFHSSNNIYSTVTNVIVEIAQWRFLDE